MKLYRALILVSSFVVFIHPYTLITSGTCQDAGLSQITSDTDCATATAAMPEIDTNSGSDEYPTYPTGCLYYTAGATTTSFFNSRETSYPCGTFTMSIAPGVELNCICADSYLPTTVSTTEMEEHTIHFKEDAAPGGGTCVDHYTTLGWETQADCLAVTITGGPARADWCDQQYGEDDAGCGQHHMCDEVTNLGWFQFCKVRG